MKLAPADLVSAHAWDRVAFTTYALSLSFFETVVLDGLVRGGGSHALILADVQGVRASLGEQGARRVGKDYMVEPVAVSEGVFHPKVSVFISREECHVLVGSGNLTFGGWGGNCELIEHLHPEITAAAISDVAEFFELLPFCERVRQGADAHCESIAAALRRAIGGKATRGTLRVFHNLDMAIGDQIVQAAADLGGAERLVAASPYWDDGAALDLLCERLGLAEAFVHAHAHGCVEGRAGKNWPRQARTPICAVRLDVMSSGEQSSRRLHAKALEILCKNGRLLVSGSANCTTAALWRDGNVEACVVRIQRDRHVGWSFRAAEPLLPRNSAEEDGESEQTHSGVLRAVLQGEEIIGQVLTHSMSGPITVSFIGNAGPELLGGTELTSNSAFRLSAPALESRSWHGGRLVIRVTDSTGLRADGFVSVASYMDITARAGIVGRRLFALLAGHETPADIAAILSWFHDDTRRLLLTRPDSERTGTSEKREGKANSWIPMAALGEHRHPASPADPTTVAASLSPWERFIAQVLFTFREARGPLVGARHGSRQDDDEEDAAVDSQPEDPAIGKSFSNFEKLLDRLLLERTTPRTALFAFDLTQYVCDRLRPDEEDVRWWLHRLLGALLAVPLPVERRDDVAAAVLTILGAEAGALSLNQYRWARGCLLQLEMSLDSEPPSALGAAGFQGVLLQHSAFPELWARLRSVRTFPEQLRSYLQALQSGTPASSYEDLKCAAKEEWPILEKAITSSREQKKLLRLGDASDVCPRCFIKLSAREVQKLQTVGLATAHCCKSVLIWPGA